MVRPAILYLNDRSWAIKSESGMMWMAPRTNFPERRSANFVLLEWLLRTDELLSHCIEGVS
jgi:hypothetical protein